MSGLNDLAQRYADDAAYKADVDRALGVFHVPRCAPKACELCDAKREREGCDCPDDAAMVNDPGADAHYFTCPRNRRWASS